MSEAEARPRWRAPAFLKLSAGLHLGGIAALGAAPERWPWIVGALVADHAVAFAAGVLPRCSLLGPNLTRLPGTAGGGRRVALTFDDGPDPEVTPRVLDLLEDAGAPATFFCVGRRAERHPEVISEIVRRGHRVENHTYRHHHGFAWRGPGAQRADIERAQEVIGGIAGRRPGLFRAPAGVRNLFLDAVLARCGLRLVSWTRRGFDTVDRDARRVTRRLTRGLTPGDVLMLHDGSCDRPWNGRPVVLEALPRLLEVLAREDLRPALLDEPAPPSR